MKFESLQPIVQLLAFGTSFWIRNRRLVNEPPFNLHYGYAGSKISTACHGEFLLLIDHDNFVTPNDFRYFDKCGRPSPEAPLLGLLLRGMSSTSTNCNLADLLVFSTSFSIRNRRLMAKPPFKLPPGYARNKISTACHGDVLLLIDHDNFDPQGIRLFRLMRSVSSI